MEKPSIALNYVANQSKTAVIKPGVVYLNFFIQNLIVVVAVVVIIMKMIIKKQ